VVECGDPQYSTVQYFTAFPINYSQNQPPVIASRNRNNRMLGNAVGELSVKVMADTSEMNL